MDAIESVKAQTFFDWELIIVDDCSIDASLKIAEDLSRADSRIKLIRLNQNSGAAKARNVAIEFSTGRFITFLDGDDIWLSCKLDKQVKFMLKHNIAFSFASYEKIDSLGEPFGIVGVPERISYKELLKTCQIGCLTAMYDVEKLGKVFMPLNTGREDYATWLTILKRGYDAYGVQEVLAQYRVYSAQSSGRKLKMAKENWDLYRNVEKLGLFRSVYYFCQYAFRGFMRAKYPSISRKIGILK
jgi:teichuronic acid biosynthesis glycosyltransferase TuaG